VSAEDFFERSVGLMSPEEIAQLRAAGMGRRVGFGEYPALLVVDAQNYMIGPASDDDRTLYPVACAGGTAVAAVIARLAREFRQARRPVFFTRQVVQRDGRDLGIGLLKRGILDIDGWYIDGTIGAQISPLVAVANSDIVIDKHKPSPFHGTPLLDMLVFRKVDTVVLCGGSTSNCIRAAAIDAHAFDFRVLVVRDGVFDRVRISHEVSLMDIDRQLGDVISSDEVSSQLRQQLART
jgi:nicotinamidase-related amidase